MNTNEQLIHQFYQAFQNKDYKTMQSCYADDARFSDAVFQNLDAAQARAMWEMLIKRGKDLQLEYHNVQANETNGSAEWIATYTFSATGKKVINHIKANFIFKNGKIIKHTDQFDFYKWARQALGFTGLILGWTGFVKKKVRQTAMKNLDNFMNKSK
ncbi:MAG: nuclear transport factor 2 family protein [Saprospiraceae bacterium]|nr:nuclear transport factor 2 family protein [Saprospiraceae bacterium]